MQKLWKKLSHEMSWKGHGMSWNLILKIVWELCYYLQVKILQKAMYLASPLLGLVTYEIQPKTGRI